MNTNMPRTRTIGTIFVSLVLGVFAFFVSSHKATDRKVLKLVAPKKEKTGDQDLFI